MSYGQDTYSPETSRRASSIRWPILCLRKSVTNGLHEVPVRRSKHAWGATKLTSKTFNQCNASISCFGANYCVPANHPTPPSLCQHLAIECWLVWKSWKFENSQEEDIHLNSKANKKRCLWNVICMSKMSKDAYIHGYSLVQYFYEMTLGRKMRGQNSNYKDFSKTFNF